MYIFVTIEPVRVPSTREIPHQGSGLIPSLCEVIRHRTVVLGSALIVHALGLARCRKTRGLLHTHWSQASRDHDYAETRVTAGICVLASAIDVGRRVSFDCLQMAQASP
jgi:hypothetical protein